MGLTERAEARFNARRSSDRQALKPVEESAQVAIPLPANVVWDFVWRAETAPLVSDNVVQAFTVPGTPIGEVGEIQCHIVRGEGGVLVGSLIEVVELDPGRRAVTRSLSTPEAAASTTEVIPAGETASVLRLSVAMTPAPGKESDLRSILQSHASTYVERVAGVLRAQHSEAPDLPA